MEVGCFFQRICMKNPEIDTGPYTLPNFLPAGTLVLTSATGVQSCSSCHSEGWHTWPGHRYLSGKISGEDATLLRLLDFLVVHQFVSVTCRLGEGHSIYVRIYLIPFDLRNVEGRLRRREETTVLSPGRKSMRALLSRLTQDVQSWNGCQTTGDWMPFYREEDDTQTLPNIYNNLPSPSIRDNIPDDDIVKGVLHGDGQLPGMRSTLHQYQRGSVATMLERELYPSAMPDPLFVPIHSVQGIANSTFYIQPATMEVLCERPYVERTRGGILCEELGTGKTVMTLGLILATVGQLSSPEVSILSPRPVLTPLALRHFPFREFADVRSRFGQNKRRRKGERYGEQLEETQKRSIPSLVEQLVHFCSTHPDEVSLRDDQGALEQVSLLRAVQQNHPFYYHYNDEPLELLRSSRKKAVITPKKMYLTAATLVVVPPNLFNQWLNEINKHCDESTTSRVYTAKNGPLPSARELASAYDIVLMTHTRLSAEALCASVSNQYTRNVCQCPELRPSSVRVPNCQCVDDIEDVSPLLQIRWKRLVIDEGHVAGTTSTNLMAFIRMLSIERKWIVTGTPTTNLMGLHFGAGSEVQSSNETDVFVESSNQSDSMDVDVVTDISSDSSSENLRTLGNLQYLDDAGDAMLQDPPNDPILGLELLPLCSGCNFPSPPPSSRISTHIWTQYDREDLHKLGNMVTSFLEIPQFAVDSKAFTNYVISPLMDPSGPRPGSIKVLRQIMEGTMIRHRIEDVEKEISLPLLSQETVLLDLDPYALKTYNVMQAAIVLNAVDSERVDQDYFFHPRNAGYLHQLTDNLSQAMFWHVDEEHFVVDEIMDHAAEMRKRATEKGEQGKISLNDLALVQAALRHVESAARDPVWRGLMLHPYVPHRIYNMPDEVYKAWSILPHSVSQTSDHHLPESYHLLIPDRLKTLRNMLTRQPLSPISRMVEWGRTVSHADHARLEYNMERIHVNKTLKRHTQKGQQQQRKAVNPAAKVERTTQFLAAQDRLKALFSGDDGSQTHANPMLLASSPLSSVRVGSSASSKLNFILNEVQLYASTSKFLIFSRSPLTLLYVAEGLALMGVQYKLTSQKPIRMLEQDVTTFESSDTFRVFLMELKHGARGLNLVTASRVIFCEPVWQADVESQAIKRVHRIGQTSPVAVKTLAIRGTAEEVMVARRDALKRSLGNSGGKLPNLTDDRTMRDFIANPTFLPESSTPPVVLDFPLLPKYEGPAHAPSHDKPLTIRIPARPRPSSSSPKKRRAIITKVESDSDEAHTPAYVGNPLPSKRPRALPTIRFADLPQIVA